LDLNLIELLYAIVPFIFGLIAISLIPSKEKIMNNELKSYKLEKQIVVYMIGFFILVLGTYFFVASLFSMGFRDQRLIYFINGLFLGVVGIGILAVNHKNFSLLTEKAPILDGRVEVAEVTEVEEVVEVEPAEHLKAIEKKKIGTKSTTSVETAKEPQLVECPKCGHIIKIKTDKRPIKISCPSCGVTGMIQ
jgi:predicted RNA-binding Zn-ribbon protein involved in translation (DUF1610 family)